MRNYGFIKDERQADDFVFGGRGSLPRDVLNPTGSWFNYLPTKEFQDINNVEPYACVSFTTLNAIEILIRFQYGREENYSDRFLAKISDTQIKMGNSPHKVGEYLRKAGAVEESLWPFTSKSFDEYYEPVPPALHAIARDFLDKYEFKHEYVDTDTETLQNALKHSPIGISVPAWYMDDNGHFYKPEGIRDNHFTTLIDCKKDEYWEVFDSYDMAIKKVSWDNVFEVAKRYYIKERTKPLSRWERFLRLFNL